MQSIQIWEIFSFQRRHYSTATPWPSKLALLSKADPKTASGADKLQISLSHTAVLLQQRIGVYFSYGLFFPTCTATVRVLGLAAELWCLCEHSWELRWGWGAENAEPGFLHLSAVCCWDPASPRGRETAQLLLWNTSEDGFIPRANYDSLDLLWRHPGSLPGWWIKGCWAAKSTKHQRKRSCSHGTHFALWPQKHFTRAPLWRARQWGVVGSLAAAHLSQAGLCLLCSTKQNVSK